MDKQDHPGSEDEDIARLLRAAGPREHLPEEMKQRWEQQFRATLEPVLADRSRGRRRIVMGLCAGLAVIATAISFTLLPPSIGPMEIQVTHTSGENRLQLRGQAAQGLRSGERLPPGSVISTGPSGHVAVVYGDYDMRLNSNTRMVIENDHLFLESGEIYASDYGSARQSHDLRIDTPLGSIRDIGTQFTVASLPDRTVTTVRRGAVLINTGSTELRAEPGTGAASRLTIDQQGQVHSEAVAPGGEDWRWIYASGPAFELEGSSAYDFLQWSVGESGLQLEFASESAEIHARTILLHGNISGMDPEQAVGPVLASTDLVAERTAANTLQVSLVPQAR